MRGENVLWKQCGCGKWRFRHEKERSRNSTGTTRRTMGNTGVLVVSIFTRVSAQSFRNPCFFSNIDSSLALFDSSIKSLRVKIASSSELINFQHFLPVISVFLFSGSYGLKQLACSFQKRSMTRLCQGFETCKSNELLRIWPPDWNWRGRSFLCREERSDFLCSSWLSSLWFRHVIRTRQDATWVRRSLEMPEW